VTLATGTRLDRLELATGKRTLFKRVAPADPTAVGSICSFHISPDGRSYCAPEES
jgi:hypothetical protein